MSNQNNSAAAREIPVPPSGGSWRFDEAAWDWIPNEAAPAAALNVDDVQPTITTAEQEP